MQVAAYYRDVDLETQTKTMPLKLIFSSVFKNIAAFSHKNLGRKNARFLTLDQISVSATHHCKAVAPKASLILSK